MGDGVSLGLDVDAPQAGRALRAVAQAPASCFAAWTFLSSLGLPLKDELNPSETRFGRLADRKRRASRPPPDRPAPQGRP